MKDSEVLFPKGRSVIVADMTNCEIGQVLDGIASGRVVPDVGEQSTPENLRERLLIELTSRGIGG